MISLSIGNLETYYRVIFTLKLNNYSIEEIEDMIPFERDIFLAMLYEHKEKEKQANELT